MAPSYDETVRKPLFGEQRPRDRFKNLILAVLTGLMVGITLVSAFLFPCWPPNGVNIFFALVIFLICGSHIILIFWYREGDLEPKFRKMIYFNTFTIMLLCLSGNLYMHRVGMNVSKENCTKI